jgi:multiple sugar transport system permease protein
MARASAPGQPAVGTRIGAGVHRQPLGSKLRDYGGSLLFLAPFLLFWLAFVFYPLAFSFNTSLHKWNTLTGDAGFIGFRNYYNILFNRDSILFTRFWSGMAHTALFVVVTVPLLVVLALMLAILVADSPWRNFFRPVFYIPGVLSVTVACAIWRWNFQDPGLINTYLHLNVNWFETEPWAWLTIIITTLWWTVGLNMVILLAGILEIPKDYHEAAMIDGATWLQRVRSITVPILRPVLGFVVVTQTLASFGLFGQSQLITAGGPGEDTTPIVLYIFNQVIQNSNYATASAMTFILGVFLILISIMQLRSLRRQA